MSLLVLNPFHSAVAMPWPYRGIIPPGGRIPVDLTLDQFFERIGGRNALGGLIVRDLAVAGSDLPSHSATFSETISFGNWAPIVQGGESGTALVGHFLRVGTFVQVGVSIAHTSVSVGSNVVEINLPVAPTSSLFDAAGSGTAVEASGASEPIFVSSSVSTVRLSYSSPNTNTHTLYATFTYLLEID